MDMTPKDEKGVTQQRHVQWTMQLPTAQLSLSPQFAASVPRGSETLAAYFGTLLAAHDCGLRYRLVAVKTPDHVFRGVD